MPRLQVFKLHFHTPLHIGDRKTEDYGSSLKTIASDTLIAAITACLAKQGVEIPPYGDLGCTISSLFPYYQRDKEASPVYFLPLPLLPQQSQMDVGIIKKIKKVKWLDIGSFEKFLRGEHPLEGPTDTEQHIQGEYFCTQAIERDFIHSQVSQRAGIPNRDGTGDAQPYYVDRISFHGTSGLYFLATGDTTLMKKGLSLLAEEGIGTDRNVGNGAFRYEESILNLSTPTHADHGIALSFFIPENEGQLKGMMDSPQVAYDFERRGGWITTSPYEGLRKNVIHGFTPGSVFHMQVEGMETRGKIADLKPQTEFRPLDHPIWRTGRALFLPMIIKEKQL